MTTLKRKEVKMSKKAERYWRHIYDHDFDFDFKETGQELLLKITKQEMIGFFNETFFDEGRQTLEIHITPEKHLEEQNKVKDLRKQQVEF